MRITKQISIFIVQIFFCTVCFTQTKTIDSLKNKLVNARDTQEINLLNEIAELYFLQPSYTNDNNVKISEEFASKALRLSKQIDYRRGTGIALYNIGNVLSYKEDNYRAIAILNEAIPIL